MLSYCCYYYSTDRPEKYENFLLFCLSAAKLSAVLLCNIDNHTLNLNSVQSRVAK